MPTPRFVSLADLTEILAISTPQAYALVRSGELPAIQVGRRGQWRIETAEIEAYIQRKYAENQARVAEQRTQDESSGADVAPN